MTKPKVLVADNMEKQVLDDLAGFAEVIFQPEDVHGAIQDVDFLVVRSATQVDKDLLSKSNNLKAVIRAGVGMNNIDKDECAKLGIKALNTPGASTNAVAELAVLLMLGCSRKVHIADSSMKEKKWLKKQLLGKELKNLGKQGQLPGGVILCGGGARLPKIAEFAKKELKLPVKVGAPRGFTAIEQDPSFLTVSGLLLGSFEEEEAGQETRRPFQAVSFLKKIFKSFIP